jgi:ribose/xylose/arabinose/galactoside ABC-type transport system permease subunit
VAGLPKSFTSFGRFEIFNIPIQAYILIAVAFIAWWILNRNRIGRHLYAGGGNERAAFLMGVKVKRVRFWAHGFTGMAAALSGILLVAKLSAAPSNLGVGMELSALTVVLLGGVTFTGGAGKVSGVIYGLFLVGVLQNGLVIVGVSEFLQQASVGLTLILAVALDRSISQFAREAWQVKKEE